MFTTITHNSQLITVYNDRDLVPSYMHQHSTPVFALNSKGCYAHGNVCETCNFRSHGGDCRNSISKFLETLQSTHPEVFI